jgi:hypothetical protein
MVTLVGERFRTSGAGVCQVAGNDLLRITDALHLSAASETGFREIYSNGAKLLSAAPYSGFVA